MVHRHLVGEHECYLIQPIHIGATWSKDNLIFRSSLWDKDGNPVSLSFKKFFNLGEKPDITPVPTSLVGSRMIEKLDGSTLIFSRYKGHTVIRTRGTTDARRQDNGSEIDVLLKKYTKFVSYLEKQYTTQHSYIFEWLSPTNRIVLDYGKEPDMVLIAAIVHDDYSLVDQHSLNHIARNYNFRRPKFYNYNSIDELQKAVVDMRDFEGICLYYNDEQDILKIKSAQYLYLHRAKSEISSIEKVIDVYIDWFMDRHTLSHEPTGYTEFFDYLTHKFDYEIANMAIGHISRICDVMKEVHTIMNALFAFAAARSKMPRKFAAAEILQAHGSTGRSAIVFKVLDGKPITADDYKKILYQVLK
jgi:hypothetical protein